MDPVRKTSSNLTLTAPDCVDLPARHEDGAITTHWVPSDDERRLLARGAQVRLTILGDRHPPVRLDVDPATVAGGPP